MALVDFEGSHRQCKHPTKKGRVTVACSLDGSGPEDAEQYTETSGAETTRYAVLFAKTATGYSAHVPDLPGCVAAGATIEETAELMRKAIQMHLAGMREDRDPVSEPSTIAEYITAA